MMNKITRKISILAGFLAVSLAVSLPAYAAVKLQIVTTLFPMYDFAREIGREKVELSILIPPGTEAHSFEPKPADIVRISKADIFIFTGKEMEPWVNDLLKGLKAKNLAIVDCSRGIKLLNEQDEEGRGNLQKTWQEHSHHADGKDPHFWLDLDNARSMVDTIADALAEKDPPNRVFYTENARQYKDRLKKLDEEFKERFSQCKIRTFIYAGHFAFGYFAGRYGLSYMSPYRGFSPDAEPSPRSIAELIKKIRELGIKYVYHEELIDPKVARIISEECGAKLLLLHAAHNVTRQELDKGVTFISILHDDLEKLSLGLECR